MPVRQIEFYFYKTFHKLCLNLTKLIILCCEECMGSGKPMKWLKQKYPKLECVRFDDDNIGGPLQVPVPELKKIFKLNPNVQTFSTSFRFLSKNKWTLGSNIRLDVLKIKVDRNTRFNQDCNLLRELYQQGFYKRLHLNCNFIRSRDDWNQIQTLPVVEALYLDHEMPIVLPSHWKSSLKELGFDDLPSFSDKFNLASNTMNVERVCLSSCDSTDILAFVRHSVKVKEIRVDNILDRENGTIDGGALNKEREQLVGACKQTIYVPEAIYLATMWAGLPIKCSLIQLKRLEACQWEPQFY